MRNGIEIWREAERLENLANALITQRVGFVKIDKDIVNCADVIGIFSPETMADFRRLKKDEWQCEQGNWHKKNQDCSCSKIKEWGGKKYQWTEALGWKEIKPEY